MSHTPRSILIVEDSEPIRTTFRLALEWEGYEVFTAQNGEEALTVLRSIPPPGLILLDLSMPVMDGEQFIAQRNTNATLAKIPTIVLTAAGNSQTIAGAEKVVSKPIELDALLTLASNYCREVQ